MPVSRLNQILGVIKADIMLVDKRPGLMCHPDAVEKVNTLITHAQAYLYQKGEEPRADLCNRIDRFTGGLVIAAKNPEALKDMVEIMKKIPSWLDICKEREEAAKKNK